MSSHEPVSAPVNSCYRHPDREAGVRCQRCDRYICPACMNTASVGFHCPDCAKAGKQKVYTGPGLFQSQPTVTFALIAMNVLVFVAAIVLGDGLAFGDVAIDGLLIEGGAWGPLIAEEGEWWRIITSGFLHFGLIHLAFNMYALYILGPQLERSVGPVRFVLIYFACLIGGSFGALLVSPNALTAGASGAIFGLLGVAVFAARSVGLSIWDTGLGPVLGLNFLITFGWSAVSVGGHVGGFLTGLLCGWLVYDLSRRTRLPKNALEGAFAAITVVCFVGALWAASTWTSPIF